MIWYKLELRHFKYGFQIFEKKSFVWIFSLFSIFVIQFYSILSIIIILLLIIIICFLFVLVPDMHSLEIRKCHLEKAAGRMLANFSGFPFGLWKEKKKKNYCFLSTYKIFHSDTKCVCALGGGHSHNKLFSNYLVIPTGCPAV